MKKQVTSLLLTLMSAAPVLYGASAREAAFPPFLYTLVYFGLIENMDKMREKNAFLYLSDAREHSFYQSVCFCGSEKRQRALEALGISAANAQSEIPLFTEAQCREAEGRQSWKISSCTRALQIKTKLLQGTWTKKPLPGGEGRVLHFQHDKAPGALPLKAVVQAFFGKAMDPRSSHVFGISEKERDKFSLNRPSICDPFTLIEEIDGGTICTARGNGLLELEEKDSSK